MQNRSIAPLAVFLYFKFLALFLLVDGGSVIASLALGAGKSDYVCHKYFSFLVS